jgi:hypothetical protein
MIGLICILPECEKLKAALAASLKIILNKPNWGSGDKINIVLYT